VIANPALNPTATIGRRTL